MQVGLALRWRPLAVNSACMAAADHSSLRAARFAAYFAAYPPASLPLDVSLQLLPRSQRQQRRLRSPRRPPPRCRTTNCCGWVPAGTLLEMRCGC